MYSQHQTAPQGAPVWQDLKLFMSERCPLPVVLYLAAALYGAPALLGPVSWHGLLRGGITTLCALVILRAVDDLSDRATDRQRHPERGLVNGRIRPGGLKWATALLTVLVLILNGLPPQSIYTGILAGGYLVFYGLKNRLPTVWHPLWVNAIFAAVPFYAAGWSASAVFLAMFIWLAVVGHDFCHSVHTLEEEDSGPAPTPSVIWSPRKAALAGICAYVLSAGAGTAFWISTDRPLLFGITLAVCAMGLAGRCTALIVTPCRARARAFYVPGFLFFLIPLTGFIIGRLIS